MSGVNVAGEGVILGGRYVKNFDAFVAKNQERYAHTPVFNVEDFEIPAGRAVHVGDGIWYHACSAPLCDTYMLTYGMISFIHEFAKHEASHGGEVPGWNVGLLPA